MKKIALITGVTGQDGSYLTELLLEKNYEVHGVKRRASLFNTERIDHLYKDPHNDDINLFLHYGDLTDSLNLMNIIQKVKPDEIYNLGAQSDVAVSFAGANGHFELNVFKPLFAFNIIESSKILGDASLSFAVNCINGLKPNNKRIKKFLDDSLMLVTALNSRIGYYKAADIANKAYNEDISLKEAALALNYLSEKEFDKYVNPNRMTSNES